MEKEKQDAVTHRPGSRPLTLTELKALAYDASLELVAAQKKLDLFTKAVAVEKKRLADLKNPPAGGNPSK